MTHVLQWPQLPLGIEPIEHGLCFAQHFGMIIGNEAAHCQAVDHQLPQVAVAVGIVGIVVLRDHAADSDAAVEPHQRQDGVKCFAADVVEVDIDPVRCCCLDRLGEITHRAVVDGDIGAEILDDLRLGRAAGQADHVATSRLC